METDHWVENGLGTLRNSGAVIQGLRVDVKRASVRAGADWNSPIPRFWEIKEEPERLRRFREQFPQ